MISDEMASVHRQGPGDGAVPDERTPVKFTRGPGFPRLSPRAGRRDAAAAAAHSRRRCSPTANWASGRTRSTSRPTTRRTTSRSARPRWARPCRRSSSRGDAARAENDERGMGLALVGRLLKACLDRGVEPQTGHRAVELMMEDGKVAGVVVRDRRGPQGGPRAQRGHRDRRLRAQRGAQARVPARAVHPHRGGPPTPATASRWP